MITTWSARAGALLAALIASVPVAADYRVEVVSPQTGEIKGSLQDIAPVQFQTSFSTVTGNAEEGRASGSGFAHTGGLGARVSASADAAASLFGAKPPATDVQTIARITIKGVRIDSPPDAEAIPLAASMRVSGGFSRQLAGVAANGLRVQGAVVIDRQPAQRVFSGELNAEEITLDHMLSPGTVFDLHYVLAVRASALATDTADYPRNNAEIIAEYVAELGDRDDGTVFALPPGYTANSADGLIVNNRFVGAVKLGFADSKEKR